MTPADVIQKAREQYNAVGETFWSESEFLGLISMACQELARETKCIERVYTTTTVASQQEYDYPTNTTDIKRVTYDGNRIDPITFDEADQVTLNNSSITTVGSPVGYAIWNETLYLYPTPSEAKTLKIYSVNEPQDVSTITSTLEVPTWTHPALVNYCLSAMYAKDKDFASAKYYKDLWMSDIQAIKRKMAKKKRGDRMASVKDEGSIPPNYWG